MKKIASFTINHNTLMPGVYISRIDGDITTYDMRFVKPNTPPYLPNPVMHTIEHLCNICPQQQICRQCNLLWTYGMQNGFLFSRS